MALTRSLVFLLFSAALAGCPGGGTTPTGCTTDAECSDGNACTADRCTTAGTCSQDEVELDDANACTTDACDSATGVVTHTHVDPDDQNACTTDSCTAESGVAHTPSHAACDDQVACTIDSCDATNGCSSTPNDSLCAAGSFCDATGGCLAHVTITEFAALGAEFIELHNPRASPVTITAYTLKNGSGASVAIFAASDPTGSAGTAVNLPAGGYVYGVRNPVDPSGIPTDAAFVYGSPGTAFSLSDEGDLIELLDGQVRLSDRVDFRAFATASGQAIPAEAFPGASSRSTQLHPGALNATANDTGAAWCLSVRTANTRGAANGSCTAFVVNEVLYDYDHPTGGADSNQTFFELAGPAGGALIG